MEEQQACQEAILAAARQMCAAARTAPKARGMDSVSSMVLTGEDRLRLARRMVEIEETQGDCTPIFRRDAALVTASTAVVLIGSRRLSRGLSPCGWCGFGNCQAMRASGGGHCAYDDIDLGIAVGSAVSLAADLRIDNRVVYSAGVAAEELHLLGADVETTLAILLSASPRNIYFARK